MVGVEVGLGLGSGPWLWLEAGIGLGLEPELRLESGLGLESARSLPGTTMSWP